MERLKTAALGGLIGAALAIGVGAAALAFNIVPMASDARLKSYLMSHPKIIFDMQAAAEAKEAEETNTAEQQAIDKIGLKAFLDPKVALVVGPANAKNTVIEFYDYNCGHCRNTSAAVRAFYEKHKADTRFAFIEFPIFGEASQSLAKLSVAARKQGDKALALHFALMGEGKTALDLDLASAQARALGLDLDKLQIDVNAPETEKSVLAGYRLARQADFRGTPVFIVNGKVHDGEITEDELKAMVK